MRFALAAKLILISISILCSGIANAQIWAGYETGRFAGLNGLTTQPADLVSSPYRMDINVMSINATLFGNRILPEYNVFNGGNGSVIADIREVLNIKTDRFVMRSNFLLPSVSYSIDEKSAVAASFSLRAVAYGRISELGIQDIFQDAVDGDLANQEYSNEFGRFNAYGWTEFGLTYSRELYTDETYRITGGVTAKLLQGLGEATYDFGGMSLKLDETDALEYFNLDLGYRYNDQIDQLVEENGYQFFGSSGFGLDAGFSMEWKQEEDIAAGVPPYKHKVGIAVHDMGHIRFDAAKNNYLEVSATDVSLASFEGVNSLDSFVDTLESIFNIVQDSDPESYKVKMPTRISLMSDHYLGKKFYVNQNLSLNYLGRNFENTDEGPTFRYYVTPRYEDATYGVYLPLTYGPNIDFNTGLALRWKGLTIGSGNIISRWLYEENTVVGDIYLVGKFPLLHKRYKKTKPESSGS